MAANPPVQIDWSNTPFGVSLLRGLLVSVLGGVGAYVAVRLGVPDVSQETAILTGVSATVPSLIAMLGYGGYDQNRANNGIALPSDVTIQAKALETGVSPVTLARSFTETTNPQS